jgi:hypothetical protein
MFIQPADVPRELVVDAFVATPLTIDKIDLDYAAYMASPDVIRDHSDGRWPVEGFTIDEDRQLTAKHQADHQAGDAFTYLLLDPARTESLGCLYVNPLHEYFDRVAAPEQIRAAFPGTAAMVTFWVRQSLQQTAVPRTVTAEVETWLRTEWPLDCHVWRILPTETSSHAALTSAGLQPHTLDHPGDNRPYLWFTP